MGWNLGSVTAQACHAAVAVCWTHRDDADTQAYLAPDNLPNMRKVVLEVAGESELRTLAAKLEAAQVDHVMWVEQPENYPTCLAVKPSRKSIVAPHVKRLPLCKAPLTA